MLTIEQIHARLDMYEDAAGHLDLSVTETANEREQKWIVQRQIRALAEKFLKDHAETILKDQ